MRAPLLFVCFAAATGGAIRTGETQQSRVLRGAPAQSAPASRRAEFDIKKHAPRIAGGLAKIGFPVDLERLQFERKPPGECRADVASQQGLFTSPGHFERCRLFYQLAGMPLGATADDVENRIVDQYCSNLLVYYHPPRRSVVFLDSPQAPGLLGALASPEDLAAHELQHAWRDQVSDITKLAAGRNRTIEESLLFRCLLEGEAEAAALALRAMRSGSDPAASLDPNNYDNPLARVLRGGASAPYHFGGKFMLQRFKAGGWDEVRNIWNRPPASTEQLLHPEALYADEPTAVAAPALPGAMPKPTRQFHDTVGELHLLIFAEELGLAAEEATRLAAGWDGDRLLLFEHEDGTAGACWRIVWDREEDAKQFCDLISEHLPGRIERDGALTDWCACTRQDWIELILTENAAARASAPRADVKDAASAARIETSSLEKFTKIAYFENGKWIFPKLGFEFGAPQGWTPADRGGVPYLMAPPTPAFVDNINAIVYKNAAAAAAQALKANLDEINKLPNFKIIKGEVISGGAVEFARIEFEGGPEAGRMAFMSAIFSVATDQIVITASIAPSRLAERRPVIDNMLASLRFHPSSPPATRPEKK